MSDIHHVLDETLKLMGASNKCRVRRGESSDDINRRVVSSKKYFSNTKKKKPFLAFIVVENNSSMLQGNCGWEQDIDYGVLGSIYRDCQRP